MNAGLNPEIRLKRILKPKKLKSFLQKALPLLPEGSVLCVYIDETPIFCAEPVRHSFEETILSPLKTPSGDKLSLGVFISNQDELHEPELNHIKSVLEFTAFSISNYIESETAQRLIGEETLSKYRELALLHRSIVELNNSLRLKDVITALTTECKTSALPAEMGAVYLPEEEGFTIFDSFGGFSNGELENIVECTLFKDIIANLRGEIINDVSKDKRCNG